MKISNSSRCAVGGMLTTHEAAELLRRQPQTLRKWRHLGVAQIRSVKFNGRLLWSAADVNQVVQLNGSQS